MGQNASFSLLMSFFRISVTHKVFGAKSYLENEALGLFSTRRNFPRGMIFSFVF